MEESHCFFKQTFNVVVILHCQLNVTAKWMWVFHSCLVSKFIYWHPPVHCAAWSLYSICVWIISCQMTPLDRRLLVFHLSAPSVVGGVWLDMWNSSALPRHPQKALPMNSDCATCNHSWMKMVRLRFDPGMPECVVYLSDHWAMSSYLW